MSLPTPATNFISRYMIAIRDLMVATFEIPVCEAEGRIARSLGSWDLMDEDTENFLGHEDPEYWASTIYYGFGVSWWLEDQEIEARPWP